MISNGDEGNLENCVASRGVSVGAGLPGGPLVVALGDQLQNVLHAVHLGWEVMIMITMIKTNLSLCESDNNNLLLSVF